MAGDLVLQNRVGKATPLAAFFRHRALSRTRLESYWAEACADNRLDLLAITPGPVCVNSDTPWKTHSSIEDKLARLGITKCKTCESRKRKGIICWIHSGRDKKCTSPDERPPIEPGDIDRIASRSSEDETCRFVQNQRDNHVWLSRGDPRRDVIDGNPRSEDGSGLSSPSLLPDKFAQGLGARTRPQLSPNYLQEDGGRCIRVSPNYVGDRPSEHFNIWQAVPRRRRTDPSRRNKDCKPPILPPGL